MKKFYVYVYLDPRKKGLYDYGKYSFEYEPFYIGKGSKNRMYYHTYKLNKKYRHNNFLYRKINKINKDGFSTIILKVKENLDEGDSFEFEKKLIKLIGNCYNKGPLTNMTDGGEGTSGWKVSKELRKKHSDIKKGIPLTEEHISNKSKIWLVISPQGDKQVINNLNRFCRENSLTQGLMHKVSSGERNHHKGWKCEKMFNYRGNICNEVNTDRKRLY